MQAVILRQLYVYISISICYDYMLDFKKLHLVKLLKFLDGDTVIRCDLNHVVPPPQIRESLSNLIHAT